jgi:hypothetical protein
MSEEGSFFPIALLTETGEFGQYLPNRSLTRIDSSTPVSFRKS